MKNLLENYLVVINQKNIKKKLIPSFQKHSFKKNNQLNNSLKMIFWILKELINHLLLELNLRELMVKNSKANLKTLLMYLNQIESRGKIFLKISSLLIKI